MIWSKLVLCFCVFFVVTSSRAQSVNKENVFGTRINQGKIFVRPSSNSAPKFPNTVFLKTVTDEIPSPSLQGKATGHTNTFSVTDLGSTGGVRSERQGGKINNINLIFPKPVGKTTQKFPTAFVHTSFGGFLNNSKTLNGENNFTFKNLNNFNSFESLSKNIKSKFASNIHNVGSEVKSFPELVNFPPQSPNKNIILNQTEYILDEEGSDTLNNGVVHNVNDVNLLGHNIPNLNGFSQLQSHTLHEGQNPNDIGKVFKRAEETRDILNPESDIYSQDFNFNQDENTFTDTDSQFVTQNPATVLPLEQDILNDFENFSEAENQFPQENIENFAQTKNQFHGENTVNRFQSPLQQNIIPSPKDQGTSFIQRLKPTLVLNNVTPDYDEPLFFGQTLPLEVTTHPSFQRQNTQPQFEPHQSQVQNSINNAIPKLTNIPKFRIIQGTKDERMNLKLNNPVNVNDNFFPSNFGVILNQEESKLVPKGRSLSGFDSIPPHKNNGFIPGKLEGGFIPSNYFKSLALRQ